MSSVEVRCAKAASTSRRSSNATSGGSRYAPLTSRKIVPTFRRSSSPATRIASSRSSPATNRDATFHPSRPVARARNQRARAIRSTGARSTGPFIASGSRDAGAKQLGELADPGLAALREEGLAMDEPGVELLAPQGILEPFGDPIEHRRDHLHVDVAPDVSAPHAELDELEGAVGVLAAHEPADGPPQAEARVVSTDHRDPVRYPLLGQELLGALEPVVQDRPEPPLHDLLRGVEPAREH